MARNLPVFAFTDVSKITATSPFEVGRHHAHVHAFFGLATFSLKYF